MSSTPSLKYSKRIAAIGAASAAVLSLGTASAAVTTIDANVLMSNGDAHYFAFVPNGSSYVSGAENTSSLFAGKIRYCGLTLMNNDTGLFQWTNGLLSEGATVGASSNFQNTFSTALPAEGTTMYAGYRYATSYTEENPNYIYGYISVTVGANNRYTVDSYSYESTENTGVTIAAVPEPSAALLAFAGAGLFFRRRRAR